MGILVKSGNGNVLGLLKAAMTGIQYVNDLFFDFYTLKKYEALFTGQIIYLKKYLNEQFDSVQKRIYISTNVGDISPFFYRKSEGLGDFIYRKSEGLGTTFLQRKGESISDFDFTVYVPTSLSYDATQFNAAITKYKLPDKTYNIQTY